VPSLFFHSFEVLFLLGLLSVPIRLYVRKQVRNNPARQVARGEDVTYRGVIWVRYRRPDRLWRPDHWFYARGNPTEIIIRASTFQVSRWSPFARGRRYGWFLKSEDSTMSLSSMNFAPFGRDQCIIVSGSYPWRGGSRRIDLSVGTRDRTREIWDALAASGVRAESGPAGDAPYAPLPAPAGSSISYGLAPAPTSRPIATRPGPPPAPSLQFQPSTASAPGSTRKRQYRRTAVIAVLVLSAPVVLGSILAHIHLGGASQQPLVVSLGGPASVATVTDATCDAHGAEVDVAGFITPVAAPAGLTVYATVEIADGATSGPGAVLQVPAGTVGQPQPFHLTIDDNGATGLRGCNLTWSATSAAPTS
jgi:hypothetical protein